MPRIVTVQLSDWVQDQPISGIDMALYGEDGELIAGAVSGDDGRCTLVVADSRHDLQYRLFADAGSYFSDSGNDPVYSEVIVGFRGRAAHVVLCLGTSGYTALIEPPLRAAGSPDAGGWDERFVSILRARLQFLPADEPLAADLDLRACGLDSIGAVDLLVALESAYGVRLAEEASCVSTFATPAALWNSLVKVFGVKP